MDKEASVAEMIVEEEGVKKIKWKWRRRLFQWEEEMVEVCSGVVLGAGWGGNVSGLRMFGTSLSLLIWCGRQETEEHLFFNCPMLGATWRGIVRWIGIPVALAREGVAHLTLWKNIVPGSKRSMERMGVIWFAAVTLIWKMRNNMVFNHTGLCPAVSVSEGFSDVEYCVESRREIPKCNNEALISCVSLSISALLVMRIRPGVMVVSEQKSSSDAERCLVVKREIPTLVLLYLKVGWLFISGWLELSVIGGESEFATLYLGSLAR
ncbi:hypothetical protein TSUD_360180 [Trifolium subterraneum]|uniref:Reverse transcriptase zinc-binding domain-containing protein n=1 Tax=Trifolium subterraneum TaxID=3900 RepID=A0A2Z6N2A0_TRISU|nr:hypothetical protein TSUD_360180 [Trifolium subterraneum]